MNSSCRRKRIYPTTGFRGTWYTHMPKPVYEEGDVTMLWNQAVHTDKEVSSK